MASLPLKKRFNLVDWSVLAYTLITFVFISVFASSIEQAYLHLLFRAILIAGIVTMAWKSKPDARPIFQFLRVAYPLAILGFFYSETDALNNLFSENLDYHFARLESLIFGKQMSLVFYDTFPQKWFSELMNLGYFSYFFLITGFAIQTFISKRELFQQTVFIIIVSFFFYYILFILIPVAGPQFYFQPPHNQIADSGIFRWLVKFVEFIGERPTAAFPSSHVGIVFILLILATKNLRKALYWLLPFAILMTFSTVYIKAHYAVDVIGGLISAPLFFIISSIIWSHLNKKRVQ